MEPLTDLRRKELQTLALHADAIVREEMRSYKVDCSAEVRVLNMRSVGVQGDQRTYAYPVEVSFQPRSVYDNTDFLQEISRRIPNEIENINRVLYDITPQI
jgi:GMP synthase (glutamine-hydrolysing)